MRAFVIRNRIRKVRRALTFLVAAAVSYIALTTYWAHRFGSHPEATEFYTIIKKKQP